MSDKRKNERIKKEIKSEVLADEHASFSSTVDLSKGGIFISTPEPLNNGSEVNMLIHIPGHDELEVQGLVRWVRMEDTESARAGMGIEFINVSNDLKKKIDECID